MPDHLFEDSELAALYDLFAPNEGRGDFGFYLPLVMSADSVLDVGCGTGALLRLARDRGHQGRLVGLDPATGMLEQARKQLDIEWVQGDLGTVSFDSEFDLIVMSGHAFQVLVVDEEIRVAMAAVRDALNDGGRFAFETRNPTVREWEQWDSQYSGTVVDASGAEVHMEVDVEQPVTGDIVRFSHTFSSARWDRPQVSRSTLRFLDAESLAKLLSGAGLRVEHQYGDWSGGELTQASAEIITIVGRA